MARAKNVEELGPPLCIRFKKGDLEHVHRIVAKAVHRLRAPAVWIRHVTLERVDALASGDTVPELRYETAHGLGEQSCVRFTVKDAERIGKAAAGEGTTISPWIRAIVMERVARESGIGTKKTAQG